MTATNRNCRAAASAAVVRAVASGALALQLVLVAGCGRSDQADKQKEPAAPATAEAGIPPTLRDPQRLWCKEHNRYEDRCWLCHPELQDKNRLYCEEHGLYEDECFLCHPELKTKPADAPKSEAPATPVTGALYCKDHNLDESACANCHFDLIATLEVGQGMKVRLPSKESAAKVGIQIGAPRVGYISDAVECYAEIGFNQNKLAQIPAPVAGIVRSVAADLGSKVEENAVLAKLWSAAMGEAVSKMVLAGQTLERERKLRAEKISSEKDFQEAEVAHRMAVQQLTTLGFSDEQLRTLAAKPDEATLEIRAPFAGEIIQRHAVRGALVETGKPLFTVADLSEMWATLNIPESQLARLRVGQTVELNVEAIPTQTFRGSLTWIAAQVDDRTRMAQARVVVANPDGVLRAHTFARARILTSSSDNAVVVSQSAVQTLDGKSLVFVKLEDDLYEARCVRLGANQNGQREVLAGLRADDRVVVAHSYAIKSEMLKARLGAGCCAE